MFLLPFIIFIMNKTFIPAPLTVVYLTSTKRHGGHGVCSRSTAWDHKQFLTLGSFVLLLLTLLFFNFFVITIIVMRRILEQCMVKLQLKIDYNYRGENLEFGSLGFYLHIHAYCRVHRRADARRCTVYLGWTRS